LGNARMKRKEKTEDLYERPEEKVPRTFVFKMGKVGSTVKQLVLDVRQIMEPNTASRLETKAKNSMKDMLSVAGPLGVTHFLVFSQTDRTLSLRLAKCPKGPTLQFKIESFSTARDVQAMQVKHYSTVKDMVNPPLVVLNNFAGEDRHLKLMTVAFQNMFPAINVHAVNLQTCSRVVLFHRDPETNVISMRHYKIVLNPLGLSKSIKRIAKKPVSLGDYEDVSDFVLSQAKASESDLEDESEAQISVEEQAKSVIGGKLGARKAAVRLYEIGPRIEMSLSKIMADFMQGEVMWHWQGVDLNRLAEQKKADGKRKAAFPGQEQVAKRERFEKELARKKELEKQQAEEELKRARLEKKQERKEKQRERRQLMGTRVKQKKK